MESEIKPKSNVQTKQEIHIPKMYKVLMHNDDITPMDFVVSLLSIIFGHNEHNAYTLMMKIHTEGLAVCGIYTYEVAQTRTLQAKALAKNHAWPLNITIEVENDHKYS